MTFRRTRAPPKSRAWRQATNSGTIDRPYDRVSAPSPPSQRRSRPHAPEASITTRASNRGSRPEALQLCPRRWGRSASWARAPSSGRSRRRPWRRHHRPVLELSTARGLHRLAGERGGTACLRSGGSGPGSVLGDEDLAAVLGGEHRARALAGAGTRGDGTTIHYGMDFGRSRRPGPGISCDPRRRASGVRTAARVTFRPVNAVIS